MKADAHNRAVINQAIQAIAFQNNQFKTKTTPKMIDTIAQRVLTQAKKNAPVRTGALRASGRVKRVNQHRRQVQFGGAGTGVDYAQAVEFGTITMRPRPFFEPAIIKVIKKSPQICRPITKSWLRQLVRLGEM